MGYLIAILTSFALVLAGRYLPVRRNVRELVLEIGLALAVVTIVVFLVGLTSAIVS